MIEGDKLGSAFSLYEDLMFTTKTGSFANPKTQHQHLHVKIFSRAGAKIKFLFLL